MNLITIIKQVLTLIIAPVYADNLTIDVPTGIDKSLINPEFLEKFGAIQGFWGKLFTVIIGILVLMAIIAFSINSYKFSKNADNSKAKQEIMHNFTVIAITTAILGGFAIIMFFLVSILGIM